MRILNAVIRQVTDELNGYETFIASFVIGSNVKDPEAALRAAVQDYISSGSDEAETALKRAHGNFNWGDVMIAVPGEYFIGRGLTPLMGGETVDINLEHDEVLDPDFA